MVSFYPGPSQIDPGIPGYLKEALDLGITGINHRSKEFVNISKTCRKLLRKKLVIPASYEIFFVSSATECWEIIAQSFAHEKTFHLFNGAFGERWYQNTKKILKGSLGMQYDPEESIDLHYPILPDGTEVICLTHNETSNGTRVRNRTLRDIRKNFRDLLIAVDATSSMAGVALNFKDADIWFASVQKCFGLPAGMGIMICSPKAVEKALVINEKGHYNSMVHLIENMKAGQTTHTPNVLSIFLMMKVMEDRPLITKIDSLISKRYKQWIKFLQKLKSIEIFIHNSEVRSRTVLTIQARPRVISRLKNKVLEKGYILGNGYGQLNATTLRIANFPAISDEHIQGLKKILKKELQ